MCSWQPARGGTGTSGRDSLSLSDNRGLESANSKILSTLQAQGLGLKQNIDLLNAASAEAAALKEAEASASAGNPRSTPPDRWIPDSSGNGGTTVGSRDDWQTNNAGNGSNVPRYDSMKSIDGLDAWLTFNSVGRAAAGIGALALNTFTAIPGMVRGAWRLGQDAYGYASYALAPQRSLLTGQAFAYQPKSALMQSIEQQGVLGTVGAGITGAVRNAPGIGVIGALAQPDRDWRNVGEQLANTGLAAAGGTMGKSLMGVANSGGKSLRLTELDPMLIRTTQTTVKQQGATIPKLVESMKQNGFVVEPDRLIDVVRMPDGILTSLDNTRILAAQRAGVKIQARVFDHADALPNDLDYVSRFIGRKGEVPTTFGDAVQNRISNQSSTYRNLYPYGSPFIGSAY